MLDEAIRTSAAITTHEILEREVRSCWRAMPSVRRFFLPLTSVQMKLERELIYMSALETTYLAAVLAIGIVGALVVIHAEPSGVVQLEASRTDTLKAA